MTGCWQAWLALAMLGAPPTKEPSTPAKLERYEYAQVQMGALFKIIFYAADKRAANTAAEAAYARAKQLNDILSDYDEKSELSRLSDTAGSGKAVAVRDDLWRVLVRSLEVSRDTEGAFDISVGPLVRVWRQSRVLKMLLSHDRLAAAI